MPAEETHSESPPTDDYGGPPPASGESALPNPFGRYELVRKLGKGGMGSVYLARDTHLDRLVALKVPRFDAGDPHRLRERFLREAKAAALLHHPHVCPVFDIGSVGDLPYLTMAYIEGRPLDEWAADHPDLPAGRAVALVRTLALALEEAHRKGVIHRDLKPSNVLITDRGEPVVTDFGLARRVTAGDERLTQPGSMLGTPAYMPPEQVMGDLDAMGPASDVYSLGVILYELLTGRRPFTGPTAAVLAQIVGRDPPPPRELRPGLDPRLEAVCAKAMAKDRARRFARMAEFADALAGLGAPTPAPAVAPQPTPAPKGRRGKPRTAPTAELMADPAQAAKILETLQTWGASEAVHRIRFKLKRSPPEPERVAWQGFHDWMTGDRTPECRAAERFQALPVGKALRGWALAAQASRLLRDRDLSGARKLLERAAEQGDAGEPVFRATLEHYRGLILMHEGRPDEALAKLHAALAGFGRDHFAAGRVLDSLGAAYAAKGSYHVAREFYDQSVQHKTARRDQPGLAVLHGQLGRLFLEVGQFDAAERHFHEDLRWAQKTNGRFGEAQMYGHLGRVALARAERETAAGRQAAARRCGDEAAGWLDESVRLSREGDWPVQEGYARTDRAALLLLQGDVAGAAEEARLAAERFQAVAFAEGQAKVRQVQGRVLRAQGRFDESVRELRAALGHFEATQEHSLAARALRDIARTLRESRAPAPVVTRAYREALLKAESCRHASLVQELDEEFRAVAPDEYLRHVYLRVRGVSPEEDVASLPAGAREAATVLAADLPGFAAYAQALDPEAALTTLNQLFADVSEVLARHRVRPVSWAGGGLLATAHGPGHARRAVAAALDLAAALDHFNEPRRVLGLPLIRARLALASGETFLGNVGTYQKMEYTAVGPAVERARALLPAARPDVPALDRATCEFVRGQFALADEPRHVAEAGEVWDVTGRREE